jgi:hypothetical protein
MESLFKKRSSLFCTFLRNFFPARINVLRGKLEIRAESHVNWAAKFNNLTILTVPIKWNFNLRKMSFIFSGFRAFLLLVMIGAAFENILSTGTDMAGTQKCHIANILLISVLYMRKKFPQGENYFLHFLSERNVSYHTKYRDTRMYVMSPAYYYSDKCDF